MIIEKQWHQVKNVLQAKLDSILGRAGRDHRIRQPAGLGRDQRARLCAQFPHLTCVMCSIEQGELLGFARGQRKLEPDFKQLNADVALLPATCYKIYLGLKGQQLDGARVESCIARCFRHEDKALDSYRAFNFTMKEYVYLGTAEGAQAHLEAGYDRVFSLFAQLGIRADCEEANDPFFDSGSPVARLSALTPTKRELVFDGHAVSSLNYHRNYFGEVRDPPERRIRAYELRGLRAGALDLHAEGPFRRRPPRAGRVGTGLGAGHGAGADFVSLGAAVREDLGGGRRRPVLELRR